MNENEKSMWTARFFLFEIKSKNLSEKKLLTLLSQTATDILFELLVFDFELSSKLMIVKNIGKRKDYELEAFQSFFKGGDFSSSSQPNKFKAAIVDALGNHPGINKEYLLSIFKNAGEDAQTKIAIMLPYFENCTVSELHSLWQRESGSTVGDTLLDSIEIVVKKLSVEEILDFLYRSCRTEEIKIYISVLARKEFSTITMLQFISERNPRDEAVKTLLPFIAPKLSEIKTPELLAQLNKHTNVLLLEIVVAELATRRDLSLEDINGLFSKEVFNFKNVYSAFMLKLAANESLPIWRIKDYASMTFTAKEDKQFAKALSERCDFVLGETIENFEKPEILSSDKTLYANMIIPHLNILTVPTLTRLLKQEISEDFGLAIVSQLGLREKIEVPTPSLCVITGEISNEKLQFALVEEIEKRKNSTFADLKIALSYALSARIANKILWIMRDKKGFAAEYLLNECLVRNEHEIPKTAVYLLRFMDDDSVTEKQWALVLDHAGSLDPETSKIAAKKLTVRPNWETSFALNIFHLTDDTEQQCQILDVVSLRDDCTIEILAKILEEHRSSHVRDKVRSTLKLRFSQISVESLLDYFEKSDNISLESIIEDVLKNRTGELKELANL